MSNLTPQQLQAIYDRAALAMRAGVPADTIVSRLIMEGLDAQSARAVVNRLAEPNLTPEQLQAIYNRAALAMRVGLSADTIVANLITEGLDPQSARAVVTRMTEAANKPRGEANDARREAGQMNMVIGALFCIGGTAVTVLTYQAAASSPGGGRYLIAWGAILFGAIQFFRGLSQMSDPP